MISLMILAAGLSTAQAQDCQPTSPEQLSSIMQQALLDFATLDEESFYASATQAEEALPCLDTVFLPPNAAAYHRLMGLRGFFDGDDETAVLAFRAAQSIEPGYVLSTKLAPEGGKLHRLWTQAADGPNPFMESFSAPAGKYAYVNGTEGLTYAGDLPNIVQYGPGDDTVIWSAYVAAGTLPPNDIAPPTVAVADVEPEIEDEVEEQIEDDLDSLVEQVEGNDTRELDSSSRGRESSRETSREYSRETSRDEGPQVREDLVDAPKPEKTKSGGKGGLIAATVISGVAAGGLYGGSAYFRSQFDRNPTREGYMMTNGAYFGAIGAGALTLTFGSLAVFTGGGH